MARHRRPQADLSPVELRTFDRQQWARERDNGRWQPAFQRWKAARRAFCEAHPESMALGNKLERMRIEYQAQFTPEHYPPDAKTW
jgi:hypothetical protein